MHKLRNNILILSISFTTTLIALLLLCSMENSYKKWSNDLLNISVSDIEIMTTNYYNIKHLQPNNSYLYNYPDYLKILTTVVDEDSIAQILKYNGYIVSPKYEYKVLVNGIEPDKYKLLFPNITNITSGKYLSADNKYSSIIGSIVAEKLKLKVGDRFIIRLLDVNNLYKAEEFEISGIFKSGNDLIDGESVFINIGMLNDLIADNYALSSIHIKSKNIYNKLRKLFSDDIGIYTKYDINTLFTTNENKIISIKRYIYLFFSITIFSIYFYINAKAFSIYENFNSHIIKNIFYAFIGFLIATFIVILFFKSSYSIYFTILFVLNILFLLLSGFIPYIYAKKRVVKS